MERASTFGELVMIGKTRDAVYRNALQPLMNPEIFEDLAHDVDLAVLLPTRRDVDELQKLLGGWRVILQIPQLAGRRQPGLGEPALLAGTSTTAAAGQLCGEDELQDGDHGGSGLRTWSPQRSAVEAFVGALGTAGRGVLANEPDHAAARAAVGVWMWLRPGDIC
ncbi:hypothetical protein PV749_13915 [Streptomyces sp. ID03-2B]|nr:hypothetical protein [Streptomyces sp. ID03-2B]MDX3592211.1 hypothetical protein [Streptomyces sp. ID03-2B]